MHKIYIFIAIQVLLTCSFSFSQELTGVTPLSGVLSESSGLHFLDGRLLTIEDSGNENAVFEVDTLTGEVIREVLIGNATNTDWESITADDSFLYIGEFGNNSGSRQDLKIFKIPLDEYLETESTQSLEVISFSYSDQSDFTPAPLSTNFDAEAFCTYGDSLILFSKNWINGYSKIYKLPKEEGTYELEVIDSINTEGLVTGCDCNDELGLIHLIGHNALLTPFVVRISDFSPGLITDGIINRVTLSALLGQSTQIEGIANSFSSNFFASSEEFFNTNAWLFELNWELDLSTENPQKLYLDGFISPNPSSGSFRVDFEHFTEIQVIDHSGKIIYRSEKAEQYRINIEPGLYQVILKNRMNHKIASQRLVIINP